MTDDRRAPDALAIWGLFGDHGQRWITDHIMRLEFVGDIAGTALYRQIGESYRLLLGRMGSGPVQADQRRFSIRVASQRRIGSS